MELTYEEAFFGKTVNVTVARERLCHTCGATGSAKPEEMPTVSRRGPRGACSAVKATVGGVSPFSRGLSQSTEGPWAAERAGLSPNPSLPQPWSRKLLCGTVLIASNRIFVGQTLLGVEVYRSSCFFAERSITSAVDVSKTDQLSGLFPDRMQ